MVIRVLFVAATMVGATSLISLDAHAQDAARAGQLQSAVDYNGSRVLTDTGVPGASVAVVTHGRVVYAKAYRSAKPAPGVAASPDMRYVMGSKSKQFPATAILLLQQEGKLSLDDPVSRYVTDLTRGDRKREVRLQRSGVKGLFHHSCSPRRAPAARADLTGEPGRDGGAHLPSNVQGTSTAGVDVRAARREVGAIPDSTHRRSWRVLATRRDAPHYHVRPRSRFFSRPQCRSRRGQERCRGGVHSQPGAPRSPDSTAWSEGCDLKA